MNLTGCPVVPPGKSFWQCPLNCLKMKLKLFPRILNALLRHFVAISISPHALIQNCILYIDMVVIANVSHNDYFLSHDFPLHRSYDTVLKINY